MKKYKSYKPSGIEFIGDIPEHWEVRKLKYLVNINSGEGLTSTNINYEGLYKVYGGNGKIGYYSNFNSENSSLIIGRVGAKCGNVHIVNERIWITDNALIVKTIENYKYMYYCLTSINLNKLSTSTAQPLITSTDIKNYKITLPSLQEQQQIANFLDKKTKQIEEFIKEKKYQITLLEEQKEAIINQAITKGLDEGVEFKDSGIEWIGEIPKHWEVKKIKYCVLNKTIKSSDFSFQIALENIESKTSKFIETENNSFNEAGIIFKKNDILFGKLRPYLVKVFLVEQEGICVSEFLVLEAIENIIFNKFVKYLMLSSIFIDVVNGSTYGSKMPRASWEFIGNLKITLPIFDEQKEIIKYIEIELSKIDKVIIQIQREIDLIQEYKISLISEVVIGQIDVR